METAEEKYRLLHKRYHQLKTSSKNVEDTLNKLLPTLLRKAHAEQASETALQHAA